MSDAIRIGRAEYKKNASGEFRIPLARLSTLRFTQVPFYSDVKVTGLPGNSDTYQLEVTARHAGGPHNEEFDLNFHVNFQVPGTPADMVAVQACNRRIRNVNRIFHETAAGLGLGTGPSWIPFFADKGTLYCIVSFHRSFGRQEDPVLAETVRPFVVRFKELLKTKDRLLFLCHASEDKPFVDHLCSFLDAEDVAVWYDRREIRVGESIVRRISEGLDAASHVVVVLSKASVVKEWVRKEISTALMRQLQKTDVTVLPLVKEECSRFTGGHQVRGLPGRS